ncbi:RNA polymerase sigma factor [Candidatus Uabimicrobium amorphum]|uniref:RNA polymerase subunit sigma-24 n=1 Tax=Uabimicrobium amorphum TaxID=2596890 RepID=A0A5S9IPK8_UABAM|nr:sigma-70 family RNA polymerase sigma factor [Candidatus Uabimicrobium amorphum]BBM85753.1 RNA polymerase subunit sigma-24 [Candidatus Uabimicrobium amorphum]
MWNTTSWSKVLQAKKADKDAIQKIYSDYNAAIEKYLMMKGLKKEDAQDYTQAFFVAFLEKNWIERADQSKGKFRTFLLTLISRFVRDHRGSRQEQFERGFVHPEDNIEVGQGYSPDPKEAEVEYHRAWAESLLEIVLDNMRKEIEETNMSIINYKALWLYFFSGSLKLKLGDLTYPGKFMRMFCSDSSPVVQGIQQYFSPTVVQEIAAAEAQPPIATQKKFVDELNHVLETQTLYDGNFFIDYLEECRLFQKEINDGTAFIEKIYSGNHPHDKSLHKILQVKFPLENATFDALKKNTEGIVQEINQAMVGPIFSNENYQRVPKLAIEDRHKAFLYANRYLLQKFYPQHIPNASLRLNRRFLEKAFPDYIVANIYDTQLSYEKLAQHFSTTKSSMQKTIRRGSLLYKRLLHEEVSRYTQDENVEEEINDLLQILSNN